MQLIFAARRGRRVLHRVNLQQSANLSTRVPLAGGYVQRRFAPADTRAALSSSRSRPRTLIQLGAALRANQYTTSTTSSSDASAPKRRGRPPKSEDSKTSSTPKKKAAKRKPKKKVKKVAPKLSEDKLEKRRKQRQDQKIKDTIKALIAESLKNEEPKLRSPIAWNLFASDKLKGIADKEEKGRAFRDTAAQYRQLSDSQREALEKEASKLSKENAEKMREWVHSYTPLRIKQANAARKALPKFMAKHEKSQIIKLSPIPDDRQVKRPTTAFLWYFKDRIESGEYRGLPLPEISARARTEWLNASDSEKQPYLKKMEEDRERYAREYRETYGEDPIYLKEAASKKNAE